VVLGHAFGRAEGVAVDTHVLRVAGRLGLARSQKADEVERELIDLVPRHLWTRASDLLIFHGRKVCHARQPACDRCPVLSLCRWPDKDAPGAGRPTPATARRRRIASDPSS
jgi:endonuclease-3